MARARDAVGRTPGRHRRHRRRRRPSASWSRQLPGALRPFALSPVPGVLPASRRRAAPRRAGVPGPSCRLGASKLTLPPLAAPAAAASTPPRTLPILSKKHSDAQSAKPRVSVAMFQNVLFCRNETNRLQILKYTQNTLLIEKKNQISYRKITWNSFPKKK